MKIDNHIGFGGPSHPTRFERAAEQFESLLINELLAPLAKQQDDTQDGAGSQVKQTALQALSTAMSRSGGIGIARMMEQKPEKVAAAMISDLARSNDPEKS